MGDYRRLLDRKDIDAVVVTTPDHWHALITIQACQAGKDVYCEKPLSLTVAEGRKMVDAARKHHRIVQTGSQQRSDDRFRLACELVRSGKLGKIQEVLVGIPAVNFRGPAVADSTPPANLDYDVWLGPAPLKPYNEKHVHYNFRFFWDYSGGQMTNFGAHHLDIAQWALGMDSSGPVEIEGTATFDPTHTYEVTRTCRITYTYENGVRVVLGQEQKDIPQAVTFIGSEGRVFVDRKKIESTPRELVHDPPRRKGRSPLQERESSQELSRVRQEPRAADLRRRDRPSIGDGVPPGKYRGPARPQADLGPLGRTDRGRRRRGPLARPSQAGALYPVSQARPRRADP